MGSQKFTVGFIGLGRMGKPMAKNILKKGYPLIVWNRTKSKAEELVYEGAKQALTPKNLAEKSQVIITMLANPKSTEEVLLGFNSYQKVGVLDGLSPGKIVIDMSTNMPTIAKKLSERIKRKGCEFVDAPVMGSVKPAAEGTLTILASGKKEVVEKITPLLQTMGSRVWYVGEQNGFGCSMKLVMNLHLSILAAAFSESIAFGVKLGLNPKLMVEIFNSSLFKTYVTETKGIKILEKDYTPAFTVELMEKDLNLIVSLANIVKASLPLGSLIKQFFSTLVANGRGGLDYSAITTFYELLNNVKVSET